MGGIVGSHFKVWGCASILHYFPSVQQKKLSAGVMGTTARPRGKMVRVVLPTFQGKAKNKKGLENVT